METLEIRVFPSATPVATAGAASASTGGNPALIGFDADRYSGEQLRHVAADFGHECGFVQPSAVKGCGWRFRFFVPGHEMEMCGHATVGALWCLHRRGEWDGQQVAIETLSGIVRGELHQGKVRISQPAGHITRLDDAQKQAIAGVLGIPTSDIEGDVLNASTSRVKTLVRLRDQAALNALRPDFGRLQALCENIGSTGLYPFAVVNMAQAVYAARQFPRASGYPEDAATGIAATALAFGLLELHLLDGERLTVQQGAAMGSPSELMIELLMDNGQATACWLSGRVEPGHKLVQHARD